MFNAKDFMIDRVRRVTEVNLNTGLVNWTATSIENPQVEFTGESTDKTDAMGVLIARFDTSKGVTFSGEASTISMPMMASQLGTTMQIADTGKKLRGKIFEVLKTEGEDGGRTATTTYTPDENKLPKEIYTLSADKNIDKTIAVGETAESEASISGNTVTLPTGEAGNGVTMIGILYEYETENAVMVSDSSEEFAEAAEYLVDVLAADICNPAAKRAGTLVFPKAKIDNNFTINLTAEGTHPFSFSALKDYCADEAQLCYWIWNEK